MRPRPTTATATAAAGRPTTATAAAGPTTATATTGAASSAATCPGAAAGTSRALPTDVGADKRNVHLRGASPGAAAGPTLVTVVAAPLINLRCRFLILKRIGSTPW